MPKSKCLPFIIWLLSKKKKKKKKKNVVNLDKNILWPYISIKVIWD